MSGIVSIQEVDLGVHTALRTAERTGLSRILDRGVFIALLSLVPLTFVPYGTVEPWWEALFECAVFALCGLWLIRCLLTRKWRVEGLGLLLPLLVLAFYAYAQTIPAEPSSSIAGLPRNGATISADPYETKRFCLWLLAVVMGGWLLLRHTTSDARLRSLVHVFLGVAAASAVFALVRQSMQHDAQGFLLPRLFPARGYGQFINRNHFAFLMEMAFGLTLGLVFGGGLRRERIPAYLGVGFILWSALVLSNSRGGLVSCAAQLLFGLLLLSLQMLRANSIRRAPSKALSLVLTAVLGVGLVGLLAVGAAWLGGDVEAERLATLPDEAATKSIDGRRGVRRAEIWAATWRLFEERPVFGAGFGGYWVAITKHHVATGERTLRQAHNDYAELLASGGIVGAAIFAWFGFAFVKRSTLNLRRVRGFRRAACAGALVGIFGVAVHSLFDFGLHVTANAFAFAALVVVANCAPQAAQNPSGTADGTGSEGALSG
jgi:O-antigen ligase